MINKNDFSVGSFLTARYVRGASRWTTALIIFVMTLTFLNLTVIGGLLEGIVVGSFVGLRDRAIGDVFVSVKDGEMAIGRTQYILRDLRSDSRVFSVSPRYSTDIELIAADDVYKVTDARERRKSVQTSVLGVDPDAERITTNLPGSLIEGEYLASRGDILLGSALLERYSPFGADVLSDVHPGDFLFARIGGSQRVDTRFNRDRRTDILADHRDPVSDTVLQKYRVRGVFRTKAGELDLSVIMHDEEVRSHVAVPGNNAGSIAVRLFDPDVAVAVRDDLIASFGRHAEIETVRDAIGPFLDDIRTVFKLLGFVVGAIGLAVSSITIFIIIFVTASSRSRFIGILKSIGVTQHAIRISYVLYALLFATVGSAIGLALLYGVLVPFFQANPIQFPFSDGILYVTPMRVVVQIVLLFIATFAAGLVPVNRVVRRPSIEAVRGR